MPTTSVHWKERRMKPKEPVFSHEGVEGTARSEGIRCRADMAGRNAERIVIAIQES